MQVRVQTLVRASELLDRVGEDIRVVLACQHALRLAPGHAHASYNAVRALLNLGYLTEAETLLERALSYQPDQSDLLRLKADLLHLRGQNEQSVTLHRQLLSGAPEKPEHMIMWLKLSQALLSLQRYQEALEAAERAIAVGTFPTTAEAWAAKGSALKELGDDRGAIVAYREATRAFRGHLQAHTELARLYERHGQPFRAWREQQLVRVSHFALQSHERRLEWIHQKDLHLLNLSDLDSGE